MLIPSNHIPPSPNLYLFQTSKKILFLYFLIITVFTAVIASLPFLYVDISVGAPGIVRPANERTEIRSAAAGFISTLEYREGQFVPKGSVIAILKQDHLTEKNLQLSFRINELRKYIDDLNILLAPQAGSPVAMRRLKSEIYRKQLLSLHDRLTEHHILVKSSEEELRINRYLESEKVISPKELFDKETALEKLKASLGSLNSLQRLAWQKELEQLQQEYNELSAEQKQVLLAARDHQLTSPIAGSIQYLAARYPGCYLQAGETLCVISPESKLLAECIVSGRDIALVKASHKVSFRFDAFNYSYFGIVTGKIISIDNDFTVIDNKPVFKVRCNFDDLTLRLSNGFEGKIQKGLTLHASFILTRRSLWQLLYDKADDWINPNNHLEK